MSYEPYVEVPADLLAWMRRAAPRSAFVAAMLDVNRRKGGLKGREISLLMAMRPRGD